MKFLRVATLYGIHIEVPIRLLRSTSGSSSLGGLRKVWIPKPQRDGVAFLAEGFGTNMQDAFVDEWVETVPTPIQDRHDGNDQA